MADKTNRLNICMIKPGYTRFSQVIKLGATAHDIDRIGTFYSKRSHAHPPDWVTDFFGATLGAAHGLQTASAQGVLLVKVRHNRANHMFAVLFG